MSPFSKDTDQYILGEIENLVQKAFEEDAAYNDITTNIFIPEDETTTAEIVLKQEATIAGLKFLPKIYQILDSRVEVQILIGEGEKCSKGTILAKVAGPARAILSGERVVLNLLQHLSGIATLTKKCVEKVKDTPCEILDTRKTIPGLRNLQKYSVRVAGGKNHRLHLAESILIKDNHFHLLKKRFENPIGFALGKARESYPRIKIEVEIEHPSQIENFLTEKVDAFLLDNMSVKEVVQAIKKIPKGIYIEASGSITLENLADYAKTGVHGISIGALTHSVNAVDISLRTT